MKMKAIIHTRYGPPEVAYLAEMDKPIPKEDEVLVKVYASTVNRTDAGFRSAEYFVSRFWSGLFNPKFPVLGCEFSGVIEDVGAKVTLFRKGDRIFGYNDATFGGHAEYLTLSENGAIATIPDNLNIYESASLTEGAHYALNNIRVAKVEKGQNVMVYGATGAIGSAAVQILKHMDVHVTAVCNTKNIELIKSLGADIVIDYQTEDYTQVDRKFHFIFDAVGKSSFGLCKPLLTEKGIYVSTEFGKNGENLFYALTTPVLGGKKLIFPLPVMDKEVINYLKQLAESGELRPVIDRYYPLEQVPEAYKYVDSGQKTGNVIIRIAEDAVLSA